MEIKKDINGYEGLYKVTKKGDVFSYIGKEKKLKPSKHTKGYLTVCLYKNNNKKYYQVHRLVAETFIDNPKNKPIVNHIDEDKKNNNYLNLEWCTYSENILHNNAVERMLKFRGGKFKRKKVLQKDKTGKKIRIFKSVSETEKFGFNSKRVSSVCRGETKTHKGFFFMYIL